MQKQLIDNYTLARPCVSNSDIKQKCDFLLSALFVLEYLKDTKNYSEAQKIIDGVSTCISLCKEETFLNHNTCGCGSTI